jgi:hypothetical protein
MITETPLRNKEVTEADLNLFFDKIDSLEKHFLQEVDNYSDISNSNQHQVLFAFAVINRSISLMKGYCALANLGNYISAIPLIRLQVDNCLRFYAGQLITDFDAFYKLFLDDTPFSFIKDKNGKQMRDTYLAQKLDEHLNEEDKGIHNLYHNTSKYVHLNAQHSYLQSTAKIEEKKIETVVGYVDFYKIDQKVDFTLNMYKVSTILLKLIAEWKFLLATELINARKCL